jgi:membrane dipeptidase
MDETAVRAAALHREAVVVDAHVDTVLDLGPGRRSLVARSARGHVDLPRLREGGVDVQVFALFIEPPYKPERALLRVVQLWDRLRAELEAAGTGVRLCRTAADLDAAVAAGQLAVLLSVEGGEAVGTDLAALRALHALGVRAMGLTWNERNALADGAGEERAQGGLTQFGREVVAEMNRLGMVVDVSHLCERSFWDVLAASQAPVVASHSNARALCDHRRNLSDAQIVALARSGGVMGINFYAHFIDPDPERADIARLCDHIDHIAALVGPEHVGLGSDFDGIERTPRGLEDVTRLPAVTEALLRRGYTDAQIKLILGGNFLRLFRQVLPGSGEGAGPTGASAAPPGWSRQAVGPRPS